GGRLVERRARSVKLETLTTAGDLHNAIVRRQLVRNLEKLEHCYEKERGATPTLEATARADFTIGKDGKVRTSTVRGTGHANLDACIDAVITRLEFPVPQRGEVVVTAPIVFKSGAF
ncbi:MAG TPA: AgmX/PglI C-terminal domain-containing protein, partial [Kofleriaceae bacterium]|nr:AgmX/PglI C-terminal domain-containing protein [Kofleriaceae bacterium]